MHAFRRITLLTAWLAAILFGGLHATTAGASQTVSVTHPGSGRTLLAGLRGESATQPAVIVLHGFLQTGEFSTVRSIAEAVAGAGYTVLTPTLSLGVSARKASLACDTPHRHRLGDDVDEVAFWVKWLVRRGHKQVFLVGHSFGSLQLLAYLAGNPAPEVKQAVLVSLSDTEGRQGAAKLAQLVSDMKKRVAANDTALVEVEFGHCRKYVGEPAALLSYLAINRVTILSWLARSRVPTTLVMGGRDDRMGSGWVEQLSEKSKSVRVIAGANHFFDNQFEFDLQDAVTLALKAQATTR